MKVYDQSEQHFTWPSSHTKSNSCVFSNDLSQIPIILILINIMFISWSPCKSDITLPFCISFCLFAKTPQMAAGFLVSDEIYYVFVQKHRKYKSGFQKEPVDKKAQTCWSQQKKFSNSVITRVLSRKAAQTHKPCWFPSLPARNRNKIVLWSVEEVVFLLRLLKGRIKCMNLWSLLALCQRFTQMPLASVPQVLFFANMSAMAYRHMRSSVKIIILLYCIHDYNCWTGRRSWAQRCRHESWYFRSISFRHCHWC